MSNLYRVRVPWTGFVGAPAVSTFHFSSITSALGSLYTFFNSMASLFPSAVAIRPEPTGDTIEDTTGAITGAWSAAGTLTVNGAGGGAYAGPAGAAVTWVTSDILDARRVRGRTFLVPLALGVYESDGTLTGPVLASIQSAANALILAENPNMRVWHRPFAGRPAAPPRPAKPAHLGGQGTVVEARITDKAAVLRSRR